MTRSREVAKKCGKFTLLDRLKNAEVKEIEKTIINDPECLSGLLQICGSNIDPDEMHWLLPANAENVDLIRCVDAPYFAQNLDARNQTIQDSLEFFWRFYTADFTTQEIYLERGKFTMDQLFKDLDTEDLKKDLKQKFSYDDLQDIVQTISNSGNTFQESQV